MVMLNLYIMLGSCPLGWTRRGPYCSMYSVGAVTYTQAVEQCQKEGSVLINQIRFKDRQYIKDLTSFRDVDGSIKQAVIWINPAICVISIGTNTCPSCSVYDSKNGQIYSVPSCNELHPFMCQKLSAVLCKNGCFQNGLCIGRVCSCNPGWESEDCSKFHCRDVKNCSGRGTCVGGNMCKCRPGWMGRACSINYCAKFKSCEFCSGDNGCGWCDTEKICMPGTNHGPDTHMSTSCQSWFYFQCLTLESSSTCSDQIAVIPCDSRYCNTNATERSAALCQQCKDVERCYDISSSCHTWNETKCPYGKPVPNYDDSSRIENTEFKSNVQDINNKTIYLCPYALSKTRDNLFIYKGSDMKTGRIMIGRQCGGIMHQVTSTANINKYQLLVATPVGLEYVINYADFRKTFDLSDSSDDEVTIEESPDDELVTEMISKANNLSQSVHLVENEIYKCIGHLYSDGITAKLTKTYYVVMKQSASLPIFNVGDIIISNKTEGFLETIEMVEEIDIGMIAQTQLSVCDFQSVREMSFHLEIDKRDMACQGGNNWPGILYWENKSVGNLNGTTVVGRKSAAVLGKIINEHHTKNYIFLELVPVSSLDNGELYVEGNISHVQKHLRIKRNTLKLKREYEISRKLKVIYCIPI